MGYEQSQRFEIADAMERLAKGFATDIRAHPERYSGKTLVLFAQEAPIQSCQVTLDAMLKDIAVRPSILVNAVPANGSVRVDVDNFLRGYIHGNSGRERGYVQGYIDSLFQEVPAAL